MNTNTMRQIVLDTETTGMNKFGIHHEGHRIIEIGAVEIINRRLTNNQFHVYINPNRLVDPEAFQIHGINNQFLKTQPTFPKIAKKFLKFIQNSELIIHNASFDLGFLNYELQHINVNAKKIESYCTIIDSLKIARKIFPGQRNSLDALCERFLINKNHRTLHNALIDAKLLANVFLSMTGGQKKMKFLDENNKINKFNNTIMNTICFEKTKNINTKKKIPLKIIYSTPQEQLNHKKYLDLIQNNNNNCLWKKNN